MLRQLVFTIIAAIVIGNKDETDFFSNDQAMCMDSNWYQGYNSLANIKYQVFDVHPTIDFWIVGGSIGDNQGAIILTNSKFSSNQPREVLKITTLKVGDESVSVQGVEAIHFDSDEMENEIYFTALLQANAPIANFIFLRYSGPLQPLNLWTIKYAPASDASEIQINSSPDSFACSHRGVADCYFASHRSNDHSQWYLTKITLPSSASFEFERSQWFRSVITPSMNSQADQKWYLSGITRLSRTELFFYGHGTQEDLVVLFFQRLTRASIDEENWEDGTFMSINLQDTMQTKSMTTALPVACIQHRANSMQEPGKWTMIVELDSNRVIGLYVFAQKDSEQFDLTIIESSTAISLRLEQAMLLADDQNQLKLLLKHDQNYGVFIPSQDNGRLRIIKTDSYNSRVDSLLAQNIISYKTDQKDQLFALGGNGQPGFLVQYKYDLSTCLSLQLENYPSAMIQQITTRNHPVERGTPQQNSSNKFSTLQSNMIDDFFFAELGSEHQEGNACQLAAYISFDHADKTLILAEGLNSVYQHGEISLDQQCPGNLLDNTDQFTDVGSFTVEFLNVQTDTQTFPVSAVSYFLQNSTILIDESQMQGISAGDTIRISYLMHTSFLKWAEQVTTNTLSISLVDRMYEYCRDVVTIQVDEVELKPGQLETIDLAGITSSNDCKFSLKYVVAKATPIGSQEPTITLTEPVFMIKQAPTGAKDYTKMNMDAIASLQLDTTFLGAETSLMLSVLFIAETRINPEKTQTYEQQVYFTMNCPVKFNEEPGAVNITHYPAIKSVIEVYTLMEQDACQQKKTYFELDVYSTLEDSFTFELDALTGELNLTVWSKHVELSIIGSEHTLYLIERDSSDELNFRETMITVLFADPCLLTDLYAPSNLSETQFEISDEGILWVKWPRFKTAMLPDFCKTEIVKVKIEEQEFSNENEEVRFGTGEIFVTLDSEIPMKDISLIITESVVLADGSRAANATTTKFRLPINWDNTGVFELPADLLAQLLKPKQATDPNASKDIIQKITEKANEEALTVLDSEAETKEDSPTAPALPWSFTTRISSQQIKSKPLSIINISVSEVGLFQIIFNQPLLVPESLQNYSNKQRANPQMRTGIEAILKLEVASDQFIAGSPQVEIESYELRSFEGAIVQVQIIFTQPEWISANMASPDSLLVTIEEPAAFVSANNQSNELDQEPGTELQISMPSQMSLEVAEQVKALNEVVEKPMTFASQLTLGVNLALAYGLKHMWSMTNILQFVIFISTWKINIDPFAKVLIEQLKKLALFEFVDTESIKTEIKNFLIKPEDKEDQTAEKRRQLEDEGDSNSQSLEAPSVTRMGSNDLLDNSGVMLLAAGLILLVLIVVFCMGICFRRSPRARAFLGKISDKILFNALIRFFMQSNLKMQIAAATVMVLSGNTSTSAIIILAIYNIIPVIFALLTHTLKPRLHTKRVMARIGELYSGLKTNTLTESWTHFYGTMFMLKRSLFVLLAFKLLDYPSLQVLLLSMISLANIIYLVHSVKFHEQSHKMVQIINEGVFQLICYTLIVCNMSGELQPETRSQVGMTLITLLTLFILFNMVIIVRANVVKLKQGGRTKKLRKKQKQVLVERKQAHKTIEAAQALNRIVNYDKPNRSTAINEQLRGEIKRVDSLAQKKLDTMLVTEDKSEQAVREELAVALMPFHFGSLYAEEDKAEIDFASKDEGLDEQQDQSSESFTSHIEMDKISHQQATQRHSPRDSEQQGTSQLVVAEPSPQKRRQFVQQEKQKDERLKVTNARHLALSLIRMVTLLKEGSRNLLHDSVTDFERVVEAELTSSQQQQQ